MKSGFPCHSFFLTIHSLFPYSYVYSSPINAATVAAAVATAVATAALETIIVLFYIAEYWCTM
jgi:hypothetical protein